MNFVNCEVLDYLNSLNMKKILLAILRFGETLEFSNTEKIIKC